MRTNQSVTIHRIPPVTVILIPSVCKVSIPRCPTNPVIEGQNPKLIRHSCPSQVIEGTISVERLCMLTWKLCYRKHSCVPIRRWCHKH
ncbi:hypothetical protein CEXT_705431 [Caerostris extrusa]|uniref:Secreted protein n=1 Tax=Caerostris extrusa TaxID=172846 RepID=A0AAV4TTL3_CAEEX|nr:hypothetical protein CEXT_705431 [Caerostris extrusa]